MKFFALNSLFILFDIPPDRPFTFGVLGVGGAIALGLILSAVAVAAVLLFRKTLPLAARIVIGAVLLLIAVSSFSLAGIAVYHDSLAEAEYRKTVERQNEYKQRMREETMRRRQEREQSDSNSSPNSNTH